MWPGWWQNVARCNCTSLDPARNALDLVFGHSEEPDTCKTSPTKSLGAKYGPAAPHSLLLGGLDQGWGKVWSGPITDQRCLVRAKSELEGRVFLCRVVPAGTQPRRPPLPSPSFLSPPCPSPSRVCRARGCTHQHFCPRAHLSSGRQVSERTVRGTGVTKSLPP